MAIVVETIRDIVRLVREEVQQSRISRRLYGKGEQGRQNIAKKVLAVLSEDKDGLTKKEIISRLGLTIESSQANWTLLLMEERGEIYFSEDPADDDLSVYTLGSSKNVTFHTQ